MAGPDPAIHVYAQGGWFVDARVKHGHDEYEIPKALSLTRQPAPSPLL
jgi:hypothetical protein